MESGILLPEKLFAICCLSNFDHKAENQKIVADFFQCGFYGFFAFVEITGFVHIRGMTDITRIRRIQEIARFPRLHYVDVGDSHQPPSGGCELKLSAWIVSRLTIYPAAFGRL